MPWAEQASGSRGWTVDSQKPTTLGVSASDRGVDSAGEPFGIRVVSADDDHHVGHSRVVKADKVTAVLTKKDAVCRCRISQHDVVSDALARAPGILGCQDVVAQPAQDLGDRVVEVFVGVETGQGSGDLVLVNLRQDLVAVGFGVGPSIDKVLSTQRGVVEQELSFGHTEITCLDELPDWDAGAGDPS